MPRSSSARRLLLATLWGLAASTWSSIGHHLFGLPDTGLLPVIAVVGGILLWPTLASTGHVRPLGQPARGD